MIEIRCRACNKLFGKAVVFIGAIKCPKCKLIFEYKLFSNEIDPLTISENRRSITVEPTEVN